jgi:hypothetical protein
LTLFVLRFLNVGSITEQGDFILTSLAPSIPPTYAFWDGGCILVSIRIFVHDDNVRC